MYRGCPCDVSFFADGLWTDYNDGTWPACCSGKRFDVKEVTFCRFLCLVYIFLDALDFRTCVWSFT